MSRKVQQTSVGFGDGEVVIVDVPLKALTKRVRKALRRRVLIEVESDGETVMINPHQIKVLQRVDD